jgi:DNA-binding NarL/FixJ family response regulator
VINGSDLVQLHDRQPAELRRPRGLRVDTASDCPRAPTYLVLLSPDKPELEQPTAVTMAAEAFTLAWPQGYLRVFADEGTRLLLAIESKPAVPATVAAVPGLIDSLTAREQEVLALLSTGRSNRRIAAELVVTLDTVKKHVGHLLDKLDATNRTEGVARARQLGLIS